MNERSFIEQLQSRMSEQEKIMKDMMFPRVFMQVSTTFGNHPLRILFPVAFLLSLVLELLFRSHYDELVLKIFGGFGIL